jgi:RNA polymerase sigma factor (sigma-70 family)
MTLAITDDLLWQRYHATRSIEDRNAIVERYIPLAWGCAHRLAGGDSRGHNFTADDLVTYGHEALIRCVERYKPGAICFVTFATHRIRGAILDGIESVRRTRRKTPKPHVFRFKNLLRTEDTNGAGANYGSPGSAIADTSVAEPFADECEADEWASLTQWMPWRERQAVLLIARDGMTQEAASRSMGVSASYVSVLMSSAKRMWAERLARSAG